MHYSCGTEIEIYEAFMVAPSRPSDERADGYDCMTGGNKQKLMKRWANKYPVNLHDWLVVWKGLRTLHESPLDHKM